MTYPKLKLTYFNATGRAECTRLVLRYAKIPFEDYRFADRDEFIKTKQNYPFGCVPVLEVNGKVYAQSLAILRYVGKLAQMYPTDAEQALLVDMVCSTLYDELSTPLIEILWRITDDNEKKEKKETFIKETVPRYLGGIEKQVHQPYCSGDKPSIADIALYDYITNFLLPMAEGKVSMDTYPKVKNIVEKVKADLKL